MQLRQNLASGLSRAVDHGIFHEKNAVLIIAVARFLEADQQGVGNALSKNGGHREDPDRMREAARVLRRISPDNALAGTDEQSEWLAARRKLDGFPAARERRQQSLMRIGNLRGIRQNTRDILLRAVSRPLPTEGVGTGW